MYKIRYIKASEITDVKYVFETRDIDVETDEAAIAELKAEAAQPLEGSLSMDVVRGENYTWEILDTVELQLHN